MTHWSADYVGRPWVPAISDCWSISREIWRDIFGMQVPPLSVDPSDLRAVTATLAAPDAQQGWHPVECPSEPDAVLMGRNKRPCHVGIWAEVDGGLAVLHSIERSGVILTRPGQLAMLGYRILGSYRRSR